MIGPKDLRHRATQLREIDEFLNELSYGDAGESARRLGWTWLMGMDLDWLANQFDDFAEKMEKFDV